MRESAFELNTASIIFYLYYLDTLYRFPCLAITPAWYHQSATSDRVLVKVDFDGNTTQSLLNASGAVIK